MSEGVKRFYGSHVRCYDLLAMHTPGVHRWRRAAVRALDLSRGDTVLDIGCGTGATLPLLSRTVGPAGRVVGVDLTSELLDRATRRTEGLHNVSLVRGDAETLPVSGSIDGALVSFVVGLLPEPDQAVMRWLSLVGDTGRLALLDGLPTGWAHPLDRLFVWLVRRGAPPSSRRAVADRLTRRVGAAHGTLRLSAPNPLTETYALGFVCLTAGQGNSTAAVSPTDSIVL
jgi:phosphatidylethanolamine/phosphatidyl-N-methylethanolamine N-methyltransferase